MIIVPVAVQREGLSSYREQGGYAALAAAVERGPAWIVTEIRRAGLRGRGGSGRGAPVADKWARVRRALSPTRYVIANGAESSPVSQKDRHLMAFFPHRVLEGLLLSALAVCAAEVFIYVRGDSAEALESMEAAVAEAREAGLFGPGTAVPVGVTIQAALPGTVSGEETAVIDALEGLEGLPQPKPPHPEETGLRGQPTVVSNVETLAAAAAALRVGVDVFRAVGTPDCPGTALFTVSGAVERPGVYEVAYGTRLDDLLALAGAVPPAEMLAVLPGGLGSGPLRPDELGVPLTYEALAEVGSTLGPAAVVVIGQGEGGLSALLAETVGVLAEGSCGQCRGCQDGHRGLVSALEAGEYGLVRELATVLQYGRGNCAHPTGTARLILRSLQAFHSHF
jgi:NADH-quinone oxidoreductase subunit F